jgi:hypothetical protein
MYPIWQTVGLLNSNLPAQILTLLPKATDRSSLGSFTTGLAATIQEFLRKVKLCSKKADVSFGPYDSLA